MTTTFTFLHPLPSRPGCAISRHVRNLCACSGVLAPVPMEGWCAMMLRGTVALGLLLASSHAGSAASLPNSLRHVSCAVVRYYVAKYSAPSAEAWARSRGATDAEID